MDDNKELIEVMLTAYNKYADKIGAPHGYIACMEAALSIIQPELQKRDEVIFELQRALHSIDFQVTNALKTTTEGGGV